MEPDDLIVPAAAAHLVAALADMLRVPAAPVVPVPRVISQQPIPAAPTTIPPTIEPIKIQILPDGRMNGRNAALYLGHKEKTLAIWRSQRKGPRFIKTGGRVFYYQTDLEAWIAKARGD
jgi:hypothetical protein